MILREIEHGLKLAQPTAGYVRTPGLHASDLYGSFYKAFDPKRYDKVGPDGLAIPFDLLKMEMGTSFEEVLERAIAERLLGERPGEFTSAEGVIFSPDYLFFEDGETILGEFKLTYYSMRGAPEEPKFAKYWTQIKLYCHWLQVQKVRLYILFVCGDYKPPRPVLRCWEAEFTIYELQEEFDMIARHAREVGLL